MRWERLFDDLEAQLAADEMRELAAEVADRTRRERALVSLHERFAAVVGSPVEVRVAGVGVVRGVLTDAGPDWVLLNQGLQPNLLPRPSSILGASAASRPRTAPSTQVGQAVLVCAAAIRGVTGLAGAQHLGAVAKGFRLAAALRAVSRDRAVVDVVDMDGTVTTGTIDAVGHDFVEVAEHPGDVPRRAENVVAVRAVPFAALAAVRRR